MVKFQIEEDAITYIKRFNIRVRKIEFKIAPIPANAGTASWVKSAVEGIMQHVIKGFQPSDQIGITLCKKGFIERGSGLIKFMSTSEIKLRDIWELFSKNFQSSSEGNFYIF